MTLDINSIRRGTPGTTNVNHLLACGSALMPQAVVDTITDYTALEAAVGGYEAHGERSAGLERVYDSVARLVGAHRDEIALLENATVAWCHAFYALDLKPGDRVITCQAEYAANYVALLQRARRHGIIIDVAPNDGTGAVDVDALERLIGPRTKLIAITWIPTNGGLVNPAAAIGDVAKRHGVAYLLDACQAIGQMPVDVDVLNCDFLSATGRKFLRGPRGTGFLYVRRHWLDGGLEPAMIDHYGAPWVSKDRYELRPDARRFETWENAYALRAGLGVAVDLTVSLGLDAIQQRAWGLAEILRGRLREVKGAEVRDQGDVNCAIVSFTIDGVDPARCVATLRQQNICIGTSDPDSTRLDAEARHLPVLLRAAPHYYNTAEEIDALVAALSRLS